MAGRVMQDRFPDIWVEGELSDVRRHGGHAYMSLNDEKYNAKLKVVMFSSNMVRCRAKLENGERVRLRGHMQVYDRGSDLQLIVRTALPVGAGNIAKQFEITRKKLQAEGLFDQERKRKLPRFPSTIGVVTSAQGAALQDIIRVSKERFPVRIVVSDCTVQGRLAPRSIVMALRRLARLDDLDLVIVGRGGGSAEDLAAFSDERVAREVADFPKPTISAVGHESDTSIVDFVSDQRAATPSHAAEIAVPDGREMASWFQDCEQRMTQVLQATLNESKLELQNYFARVGDPRIALNAHERTLAHLTESLRSSIGERLQLEQHRLETLAVKISKKDPTKKLAEDRMQLSTLQAQMESSMQHLLRERRQALQGMKQTVEQYPGPELVSKQAELRRLMTALNAMSPLSVLERGYAIAFNAEQDALRSVSQVSKGDVVRVRIQDGEFTASVTDVQEYDA